jgi:GNAT superfamily N-acetyltransferase
MALTDQEFALLQKSIDAIMEKIAELNLSLTVETDFEGLAEFLSSKNAFVYQCFNPKLWPMKSDCFWFRLTDMYGRTVASHADRIYDTDDFCDLIESCELWYPNGRAGVNGNEVKVIRPPVKLAGKVGHSGSLWVDPAHRGKGLSFYLPYLSRSICLRNFSTDYQTGFVFNHLASSKVPTANYGYPHVELCLPEYCAITNKMEKLYICWISQAEAIQGVRRLPEHEDFAVDLDLSLDAEVYKRPVARADDQHVHFAPVFGQRQ